MKELVLMYALKFLGTPYKWGGNNPMTGFDCSGFVGEVLKAFGYLKQGDYSAKMIFNELLNQKNMSGIKEGAVLFFGKDLENITHVAFALNDKVMLEAGGGDSSTINTTIAATQDAFIRIRPIRKDLVAAIILGEV